MRTLEIIALVLTIIGAITWGLIGLFDFNLVALIFGGAESMLTKNSDVMNGEEGSMDQPSNNEPMMESYVFTKKQMDMLFENFPFADITCALSTFMLLTVIVSTRPVTSYFTLKLCIPVDGPISIKTVLSALAFLK